MNIKTYRPLFWDSTVRNTNTLNDTESQIEDVEVNPAASLKPVVTIKLEDEMVERNDDEQSNSNDTSSLFKT